MSFGLHWLYSALTKWYHLIRENNNNSGLTSLPPISRKNNPTSNPLICPVLISYLHCSQPARGVGADNKPSGRPSHESRPCDSPLRRDSWLATYLWTVSAALARPVPLQLEDTSSYARIENGLSSFCVSGNLKAYLNSYRRNVMDVMSSFHFFEVSNALQRTVGVILELLKMALHRCLSIRTLMYKTKSIMAFIWLF